jgi:cytoskeletal protein CcmA (bactofilin family)
MWKKEEGVTYPAPTSRTEPPPAPRSERVTATERVVPPASTRERATIGRSITIRGEVTGDEDLLIEGRVDGSVNLKQHSVTVGPAGEVKANIVGRVVTIEGNVEGNLDAEEQVILRSSALVQGDIAAPRLVLEDGARFIGGVDMSETIDRAGRAAATRSATATRPETAGSTPEARAATEAAAEQKSAAAESKSASPTGEGTSRGAARSGR